MIKRCIHISICFVAILFLPSYSLIGLAKSAQENPLVTVESKFIIKSSEGQVEKESEIHSQPKLTVRSGQTGEVVCFLKQPIKEDSFFEESMRLHITPYVKEDYINLKGTVNFTKMVDLGKLKAIPDVFWKCRKKIEIDFSIFAREPKKFYDIAPIPLGDGMIAEVQMKALKAD